ncbi:submaxillary gland androgen-regulated protein 3A-like [Anomalospiza imberbis]|uniref:submaxillary gland androgen-regulated protein 3A-like n=1 Tax=Anomalospiza imberbis TaxID=187417 RepID=UPI00358DFFA1
MVGGSFPSGQPERGPPLQPPSPPPPAPPPPRHQASAHPAPEDLSTALASSPSPAARPGTALPLPEGGDGEQAAPSRPGHGSSARLRQHRPCAATPSPSPRLQVPAGRARCALGPRARDISWACWDM